MLVDNLLCYNSRSHPVFLARVHFSVRREAHDTLNAAAVQERAKYIGSSIYHFRALFNRLVREKGDKYFGSIYRSKTCSLKRISERLRRQLILMDVHRNLIVHEAMLHDDAICALMSTVFVVFAWKYMK